MPDIDRMIGAKAEFAAGFELVCDKLNRAVIHHSPLCVAGLRPRIRMKEIGHRQPAIRHTLKHFNRVPMMQTDIAKALVIDMAQSLRDPIEKRFCPYESVVRQQVCTVGKVLPAAKADLEMQRAIFSKQRLGSHWAIFRDRDFRQQFIHQ